MISSLYWQRFTDFIADTWQRTAVLWWSQGVGALSGVAYGKLIALFVAPAALGAYNLQLATAMLLHGIVVSPAIQTYMSALQQYDPLSTRLFYTRTLVVIYAAALTGTLLYSAVNGALLTGCLMGAATCLQGAYLLNSGYFTAYGYVRKLALMQALSPVLNLALLLLLIGLETALTPPALWGCAFALNALLWLVSRYQVRRLPAPPMVAGPGPHRPLPVHLRHYGLPLLTQAVFAWMNNYIDKYIIGLLMTQAAVGYYSAGYSMGARIALLGGPLVTRLTMSVYAHRREGQPVRTGLPVLKKSLLLLWLMGTGAGLVLFGFSDQIGTLFLSLSYEPAFDIIPIIGVAYLFLSSTQLIDSTFMAYEKTTYFLLNSSGTAVMNIGLNVMLIPPFGIYGAAWAMLGSMAFQFVIALLLYRQLLTKTVTSL